MKKLEDILNHLCADLFTGRSQSFNCGAVIFNLTPYIQDIEALYATPIRIENPLENQIKNLILALGMMSENLECLKLDRPGTYNYSAFAEQAEK